MPSDSSRGTSHCCTKNLPVIFETDANPRSATISLIALHRSPWLLGSDKKETSWFGGRCAKPSLLDCNTWGSRMTLQTGHKVNSASLCFAPRGSLGCSPARSGCRIPQGCPWDSIGRISTPGISTPWPSRLTIHSPPKMQTWKPTLEVLKIIYRPFDLIWFRFHVGFREVQSGI